MLNPEPARHTQIQVCVGIRIDRQRQVQKAGKPEEGFGGWGGVACAEVRCVTVHNDKDTSLRPISTIEHWTRREEDVASV